MGDMHGLRMSCLTNEHQFLSLAPPTEQGCTIMHRAAEHGAVACGKMIWSVRPDSIYDCDKKVGGGHHHGNKFQYYTENCIGSSGEIFICFFYISL